MVICNRTSNILEEFNSFFDGRARIIINGDRIEITIAGTTLIISIPEIIGGDSMGSSRKS